jgi:histidinol-phosphate aminotransferase
MDRRNWLKNTALLTLVPPAIGRLQAAAKPVLSSSKTISEMRFATGMPPDLKARLFANENPFGPSAKARQAMIDSLTTSHQYQMKLAQELQTKICTYEGIDSKMLLCSAGSSPMLLAAAHALCDKGGNVVTADPAYDDLPSHCEHVIKVPLTADYKHDLDAMEKAINADTKIVYICNPNNPTGTILDTAKLKAFCERVSKKVPVFVDEAYIDYLPDPQATTLIDGVKKGQNIIIARTFSKIYGLAGIRMGYIIAQPEMTELLAKYAPNAMYSLSATALAGALASYQDAAYMQETLKKTQASKQYLYDVLKAEGYSYIPSSANFVMFPLKMDGKRFSDEMMKRGVGLRNWTFNNTEWCRISIGRMDEMEAFAAAFKELS